MVRLFFKEPVMWNRRWSCVLLVLIAVAAIAQKSPFKVKEELIGELPPQGHLYGIGATGRYAGVMGLFSTAGVRQTAWLEAVGKKARLVVDGKPQESEFDQVDGLLFSPDGLHIGLLGEATRDGKRRQVLWCDGKEVSVPSAITSTGFSPDGRLLYVVKNDKTLTVYLDQKQLWEAEGDFALTPEFSPSGNRVAVAVVTKHKWSWMVDGVKGPEFDMISPISFSDDGQRYAYAGANEKKGFRRNSAVGFVVVDGKQGPALEASSFLGPMFAYSLGQASTLRNGIRRFYAAAHGASNPIVSRDGKRLAYAITRERKDSFVNVNDEPGPVFEHIITDPVFSADGQHFWYLAKNGNKVAEVKDHKVVRELEGEVGGLLQLSPDESHIAYYVGHSKARIYTGPTEKMRMTVDGKEDVERECDHYGRPTFSPSGAHLGYEVHECKLGLPTKDASGVIIDGKLVKEHAKVLHGSLKLVDEHTAVYAAFDNNKILKVTVTWE